MEVHSEGPRGPRPQERGYHVKESWEKNESKQGGGARENSSGGLPEQKLALQIKDKNYMS